MSFKICSRTDAPIATAQLADWLILLGRSSAVKDIIRHMLERLRLLRGSSGISLDGINQVDHATPYTVTRKGSLRNVSLCPWTIGRIVAAALVLLHVEHDRTT